MKKQFWMAQCRRCYKYNLRHRKPVINVRVCCNIAHQWVQQDDELPPIRSAHDPGISFPMGRRKK